MKRSIELIICKTNKKKEIKTSNRNKRGTITTDLKSHREYYEQLYVDKLDNLGEEQIP